MKTTRLRIQRVYEPPTPADGTRILVDRMWPRNIRKDKARIDVWVRDIAPSTELRKWFAHDPGKWKEFRERYRKELREKQELADKILAASSDGAATLLYAARDTEHNNAVVLKEWLEAKA
jgi:uncharacterized protein YeaO (DUF488 family)